MTQATTFDRLIHAGRIIAAFAMGGTVFAGLTLAWVPAFASVDVHAVGGIVGGIVGAVANARHLV